MGDLEHYHALRTQWRSRYIQRVRDWSETRGLAPSATWESVDRALSDALAERGALRGTSTSTVKKWRTGDFAFPSPAVSPLVDELLGSDGELSTLLADIRALEEGVKATSGDRPNGAAPTDPSERPSPEPSAPDPPRVAAVEEPTSDEPAVDVPAANEPAADEPAANEPAAAEPAAAEPAADEPAEDEPAAAEPATDDEPAADEPAANEPVADQRAADAPSGASDPSPAAGAAGGRRRMAVLLSTTAAVVVVLVIAGLVVYDRAESRHGVGGAALGCGDTAIGALDSELAVLPNAKLWQSLLLGDYTSAGDARSGACPTSPAHLRGPDRLIVQELALPEGPNAALVVAINDPRAHLFLNPALWSSYQLLSGFRLTELNTWLGYPKTINRVDGHVEVELSSGALLVAAQDNAPYFFVHTYYSGPWQADHRDWGLPAGQPTLGTRPTQDFERALAVDLHPRQPDPPERHAKTPNVEALRHTIGDGQVIMVQNDTVTRWWMTADGQRWWIPDDATYACLGGDTRRVGDNVAGWDVAQLPYAGIATCPH